jgi:glycosyltransferase involved in cell wall biosynthesis
VLVPCYNEAGTIADCAEQLSQLPDINTVLLIDDGSQDGSSEICAALADQRVEALLLARNTGKSAAVREGVRAVSTEFVIVFDADMTVSPASVEAVLQALREHPRTFVYGSRFPGNTAPAGMSLAHRLGNRFFARWVSLLLHREIGDVLCGLKAGPREVLSLIPASACRWGDFDFFFGAADAGLRFVEVPVVYASRRAGKSKMRALSAGLYFAYLCAGRTLRALVQAVLRKRPATR